MEKASHRRYVEHDIVNSSAQRLRVLCNTGNAAPEPRGWFPSASYVSGGKTRIVLTGGLLSSNERSGEVWIGDVEL